VASGVDHASARGHSRRPAARTVREERGRGAGQDTIARKTEMAVDAGKLIKRVQEMRDEGYLSDAILRETVKQLKSGDDRLQLRRRLPLQPRRTDSVAAQLHGRVDRTCAHRRRASGVCGTAVAEKQNQNVGDVSKIDNYLACSPKTKSELVVLIRAGDEIFGQLDIDAQLEGRVPTPGPGSRRDGRRQARGSLHGGASLTNQRRGRHS
jgi:hypothetical protein